MYSTLAFFHLPFFHFCQIVSPFHATIWFCDWLPVYSQEEKGRKKLSSQLSFAFFKTGRQTFPVRAYQTWKPFWKTFRNTKGSILKSKEDYKMPDLEHCGIDVRRWEHVNIKGMATFSCSSLPYSSHPLLRARCGWRCSDCAQWCRFWTELLGWGPSSPNFCVQIRAIELHRDSHNPPHIPTLEDRICCIKQSYSHTNLGKQDLWYKTVLCDNWRHNLGMVYLRVYPGGQLKLAWPTTPWPNLKKLNV